MSLGRINNLLTNIHNEVEVKEAIKEIGEVLKNLPRSELSSVSNEMDLSVVFDSLNVQDEEQIQHVCEILSLCLPEIEPRELWVNHEIELARTLQHPNIKVKQTVLDPLIRISEVPFLMNTLQGKSLVDFFISAVKCMCCREESLGTKSVSLLSNLAQAYIHGFCHPEVVKVLQDGTKSDESLKTRLLNIVVVVGTKSPDKLNLMEVTGILNGIIETLKSDDILAVMANLEVLTPLANTRQGFTFLVANGILDLMAKKLASSGGAETSSLDALLYPSIVKFFASLGYHNPMLFREECSSVLKIMIKNTESENENIKVASMGGVAYYSSSRLGKHLFVEEAEDSGKTVADCFQAAKTSSEYQLRYLLAFQHFMHVDFSPPASARERPFRNDNEIFDKTTMDIAEAWFNKIPTALQTLIDMAKLPFEDVKRAVFSVLTEIVSQKWGLKKCYSYSPFMEYILDRRDYSPIINKNLKVALVTSMATSRFFENVVENEEIRKKIKDIHLHGHLYIDSDCRVSLQD